MSSSLNCELNLEENTRALIAIYTLSNAVPSAEEKDSFIESLGNLNAMGEDNSLLKRTWIINRLPDIGADSDGRHRWIFGLYLRETDSEVMISYDVSSSYHSGSKKESDIFLKEKNG